MSTAATTPADGLTCCGIAARDIAAGHAVWVNGRWRAATTGAVETAPGLVTISLAGLGLMHLPARHLLTITA